LFTDITLYYTLIPLVQTPIKNCKSILLSNRNTVTFLFTL